MTDPFAPPPATPPATPPLQPAAADLRRAAMTAFVVGLASLPMAVVLFPVGLLLGAVALVGAVRVRRRAVASGTLPPGASTAALMVGGVGLVLSLLIGVAVAVFWPQLRAYEQCRAGANTTIAQQDCDQQLRQAIMDRVGG